MSYSVKEIFYSLQGEGAHVGRPAVFCRFSGCNLWSGRAVDRNSALCRICDTDFIGTDGARGGKYASARALAAAIASVWPANTAGGFVVCTGGEPLLQLDNALLDQLHALGFWVAVETNGSQPVPAQVDWVCVSPKPDAPCVVQTGDELKLLYPLVQPALYEEWNFQHFFLQPLDVPENPAQTQLYLRQTLAYCLAHPRWRLSVQAHKWLGIP